MAADRSAAIYERTQYNEYAVDADTEPSPVRGALHLVFCDQIDPQPAWNAYDQLRDRRGGPRVPAEKIRFIHEANTDVKKARLFAASQAGKVAVLIGSTAKKWGWARTFRPGRWLCTTWTVLLAGRPTWKRSGRILR